MKTKLITTNEDLLVFETDLITINILRVKLGDSHQLKKELKPLFLLNSRGVLPMLKMVFSA